jgi:hypothetical protein
MGLRDKHVWLARKKRLCVGAYKAEHALLTFASLHTHTHTWLKKDLLKADLLTSRFQTIYFQFLFGLITTKKHLNGLNKLIFSITLAFNMLNNER